MNGVQTGVLNYMLIGLFRGGHIWSFYFALAWFVIGPAAIACIFVLGVQVVLYLWPVWVIVGIHFLYKRDKIVNAPTSLHTADYFDTVIDKKGNKTRVIVSPEETQRRIKARNKQN